VNAPEYDLVVIGSGPAGQKGAIAAAKVRKSVAVIDRIGMIGGVSVHTGTIPSKTVREAIFQLSDLLLAHCTGLVSRSYRHFRRKCLLPCQSHRRARTGRSGAART